MRFFRNGVAFGVVAMALLLSLALPVIAFTPGFHSHFAATRRRGTEKAEPQRGTSELARHSTAIDVDHSDAKGQEKVLLHRYEKGSGLCGEVLVNKTIARFAMSMAGMGLGPCVDQGFANFVENRRIQNRFGSFETRVFRA
mmetsp:Transcript_11523/g.34991  ORF Transcript_11523/g.34991 Transcript_11523/m.34991 type:complete len:141 (-) Transcript_11523:525-947(-)